MKWWAIPVAVVVGLALALLWRRNPFLQVAKEFEAADAAAKAKLNVANKGAVIARRQVEAEHAEKIRNFDRGQKRKADELRADPVALSRWLARLSD